MRGGDGVPQPAAGADFLAFFLFRAILFSWEFGVLAAMLSRLGDSLSALLTVPCCTIDHLHSSRP